jgi:phospholipid transport system substrate-binding protein
MKRIVVLVLALSLSLFATVSKEHIASVGEQKIQEIFTLLRTQNALDKKELSLKIFEIFDPLFDFELMARLSLGAPQWRTLSSKEQQEFVHHFTARLKRSLLEKLELYTDEVAFIKEAKETQIGTSTRVFLLTELVGKEASYAIDYKFYDAKERGWLIYDVDIIGVSLVQTYRSQFEGFLKDRPFSALTAWLQEDSKP